MEVVFVPRGDAVAADGEQMVAAAYACFLGGATAEDAVDEAGAEGGGEGRLCLQHLEEVEVAGEGDCGLFALAQDGGATGLREVAEEVGAEAREALAVGTQGDVAVAEAERLGALVELEALRHALNGGVGVAPGEEHHGVDEEGEEEVDHDASDHDEQPLPGGFGAKLPGLDGLLHLLCVHRFVDHAGDFDVASEGYPADVVVGAAPREEFPTFPGVEEEAEFLYADFEEFGKEEVACFMEHDEEGEAEDELEGASSYLIYRYFMAACALRGRERTVFAAAGMIPFAVFLVLVAVTPVTGFFYYFRDGSYYQGVGADYGYAYIVIFFLLDLLIVVRQHKYTTLRTKVIVCAYTAVAAAMIGLQYRYREILCTSVSNTVVLIMLYLQIQNPVVFLDTTTGIGNGTAFESQLEDRLRRKGEGYVFTIHLSKFYHIHTILGTENSNELLREIGAYLYDLCGKFHVFHTAGDAFTVFADTKEQCERLKCEIQKRFESDWVVQENRIALDMETVVQHYPTDFKAMAEYYGMREFLLENAGKSGAQVIVEADADMIAQYRRRRKVEIAVARAIREKGFLVYYQPVYSLKERQIVSLEALVRLKDPELGFISPEEFIPLAERDGNIIHIGEQVLEQCCRFLSKHVLSNGSLGIRTIHVNISMVQCLRQNLTETIRPVLESYHIPPSMLTLEVTERTAIGAPERMLWHMHELGKMGVSFALDDYGSGNANCSYLIRFPFQEIKIDKEIVWASFHDKAARIVLENEIHTIKQLGIPLIIEGIEEREQSEAMEQLGVECIQGYYYGRPLPEQECLRYIRTFQEKAQNDRQQAAVSGEKQREAGR